MPSSVSIVHPTTARTLCSAMEQVADDTPVIFLHGASVDNAHPLLEEYWSKFSSRGLKEIFEANWAQRTQLAGTKNQEAECRQMQTGKISNLLHEIGCSRKNPKYYFWPCTCFVITIKMPWHGIVDDDTPTNLETTLQHTNWRRRLPARDRHRAGARRNYGFSPAVAAIVLGNAVLLLLASITALMGHSERKTTIENASNYFGKSGSLCFAGVICISMLGWFGIQLNLMSPGPVGYVGGKLPQWFGIICREYLCLQAC